MCCTSRQDNHITGFDGYLGTGTVFYFTNKESRGTAYDAFDRG